MSTSYKSYSCPDMVMITMRKSQNLGWSEIIGNLTTNFNDGLCSGNQTEISLLSILTLTLFVSSFILLYYIDKHQSNWREKSHIIIPTIVISSISYLIQYGIAFHIFQSYSTTCIMTNALVQLSFHLFAIWISMYSVITIGIVTLICSKTSGCNITINIHPSIPLTFIFISSLGIISSILHFVLVKNDLCPGNNARESIFNGVQSINIYILCCNNPQSCYDLSLYCPPNTNGHKHCHFAGNDNTAINLYAINGWD
eukprot:74395_1